MNAYRLYAHYPPRQARYYSDNGPQFQLRCSSLTFVSPARNIFLGLLVSIVGGAICLWLKTPLPWMIGPLVGMALFNFSGAELRAPPLGREAGQLFIAMTLGLYFSPAVARETIANATMRAGFPPIHLAPVNFEVLYQEQLAQQQVPAVTN